MSTACANKAKESMRHLLTSLSRTMVCSFVVLAGLIEIPANASGLQTASTGEVTVVGRVLRADNGEPVSGATVLIAPCIGCSGAAYQVPRTDPVTTSGADGAFRFTGIPRGLLGWVHVAHKGYSPTIRGCGACKGDPISIIVKLKPAAVPTQVNESTLIAAFGKAPTLQTFRVAQFTQDGKTLLFDTVDGRGWKYTLATGALEQGTAIPDDESDVQSVGMYDVESGPSCRGCGGSLTARNRKTGKAFTIADSGVGSAFVGSSDGKVVFWFDQMLQAFSLLDHRTATVALPSFSGFEPLAARPDNGGYLVAYTVSGPCNFDSPALIRKVEADQAEQVARKDPDARAQTEENLCFQHISFPDRPPEKHRTPSVRAEQ